MADATIDAPGRKRSGNDVTGVVKWVIGIVSVVSGMIIGSYILWQTTTTVGNSTDIAVLKSEDDSYATKTDVGEIKTSIMSLEKDVRQLTQDTSKLTAVTDTLTKMQQETIRNQDKMQTTLEDMKTARK